MPSPILMPQLSPTMEEGKLAKWLVKEGDKVEPGDVVAEIETDKATMEVEAIDEGTVGRLLIAEGTEDVPINEPLALILLEDEDEAALEGYQPSRPAGRKSEMRQAAAAEPPEKKEPERPPPPPAAREGGRIFASPLARRLANEKGIDLATIEGSGPHGRIVKADVEAREPAERAPEPEPEPGAPRPQAPVLPPEAEVEEIPLGQMRKVVARRMTDAARDIPHFFLTVDCEIDELLAARARLNETLEDGKISVNDFVIRASALALRKVPEVNTGWGETRLLRHAHADIAVAVAIEDGLITPIIRRAEEKGLAEIAREAASLAERARTKKLKPEDYQGGSFSISNLGMFGVRSFTAVINPPHAAILSVGAGEKRAVVKEGALAIAAVMTVTLACDHRILDGATGARFLAAFKGFIEDPLTMLL